MVMIIKKTHGYHSNKKYVHGKGFVDSLSSSLKSIGSYVFQNKDLIAKPLLGAVGNLAAVGLEEGGKALLKKILNKKSQNTQNPQKLDAKSLDILQNIIGKPDSVNPISNIFGSGIKKF
jgi:hypothetical protein